MERRDRSVERLSRAIVIVAPKRRTVKELEDILKLLPTTRDDLGYALDDVIGFRKASHKRQDITK